ncbi:MAG: hypothetical protein JGK29_01180 [Microcoleus sp. PH2017_17_BER_D_A]|nr:hypothetical protein [Microcoleus sp. PH2017_17_BER_D_A]
MAQPLTEHMPHPYLLSWELRSPIDFYTICAAEVRAVRPTDSICTPRTAIAVYRPRSNWGEG